MKHLLFAGTLLFVIAFSEVEATLTCYNCIYNISQGAPVHNPRCGDPFDGDMIGTETCDSGEVCAKYPAFLGDNTGQFTVSVEGRCAVNTGDGCITFSDHQGGYLKICYYFCEDDDCNGTGALGIDTVVLPITTIFALLVMLF